MQSHTIDLDGPVHYVRFHGPRQGPTIVCVHGLGASHLNWMLVGPRLAEHAQVLAVDLAGFGATPLAERSASVHANAALLQRFIEAVSDEPVLLVGNSMGGMVSLLTAAAHPGSVAGLVLVDPSLPLSRGGRVNPLVAAHFAAYFVPGFGEWFLRARRARLGVETLVEQTLALSCVDPARIPAPALEATFAFAAERAQQPWADRAFLQAARSLLWLNTVGRRRYLRLLSSVPAPALVVHGRHDGLVPLSAAEALAQRRPDWQLEVLDGVGHIPHLEAPEQLVTVILAWLNDPAQAAVSDSARPREG